MSFIDLAVACLKQDGVLLVPTDTHYALAVNPFSQAACRRLQQIKGENCQEQITLCVARPENLYAWTTLNEWQQQHMEELARLYWPGPLKLLLPASSLVPHHELFGSTTIAVVCNKNVLLNAMITALGHPLAVIPAREKEDGSGLVSMTAARDNFGTAVDMVLPSNNRNICCQATTFVSLLNNKIQVLRQGDLDINVDRLLCVA